MRATTLLLRWFPLGTHRAVGPLAQIARRHAWSTPFILFLGTISSLLEGFGIGMLIPLIAGMLGDVTPARLPAPIRMMSEAAARMVPENPVLAIGAAVIALIAVKSAFQIANAALISRVDTRVGHDTRMALARRLLDLDYAFFLGTDPARVTKVLTTDVWYGLEVVRCGFVAMAGTAAVCVTAVLLVWIDWRMFLIVVAGVVLIRTIHGALERQVRRLGSEMIATNERLYSAMLLILGSVRPIRLFQQEEREAARFADQSNAISTIIDRSAFWSALTTPLVELLLAVLFIALLVAASAMGWPLATVSVFLLLLYRVQPHISLIASSRLRAAAVQGALQEVEWLLSQEPSLRPILAREAHFAIDQTISFEGVTLRYPNGGAGVEGVSFEIRPGVATALVGRSGAGKSTVVNLLCGLLEPQQGIIAVGGRPLRSIARADWLDRLAIAGQDIDLVPGTVAENIAYGRPMAAEAEIQAVARVVGADGFIGLLPQGYRTQVGEGGVNLSGGQRQRIGLARALLRRPDLLILDEATSAVDAISETEIMRLLDDRSWFRSVLVISHRRSTLMACEDGIVLENGAVREAGPLASLTYFREM